MMELICLFFPALIFSLLREKILLEAGDNQPHRINRFLSALACGLVMINGATILVQSICHLPAHGQLLQSLQHFKFTPGGVLSYLATGLPLALLLPYLERYLRTNFCWTCSWNGQIFHFTDRTKAILVISYALILTAHHLLRVFDNAIWYDEATAILKTRIPTFSGMLVSVMRVGHTPFHYAFIWLCCHLFGESGVVYHLSAFIPYLITIAVIITVVRKWFGNQAAIILLTFCSLLECAITYNLEIRMYTWCQLFTLLAYLMAYGIYTTGQRSYYLLMPLFASGAIYSHYFGVASMGLLYLVLLIYAYCVNRKMALQVGGSGFAALLLFAPWVLYSQLSKGEVIHNWSIYDTNWYQCFEFIFHSHYSMLLLTSFGLVTLIALLYELGIITIGRTTNGQHAQRQLGINLFPAQLQLTPEWVWMISGIVAVFGTIVAARAFGYFCFNIICLRYFFPTFIMVWLVFGMSIAKCPLSNLWTTLLVAFIWVTCYPSLLRTISTERANNRRVAQTLAATKEISNDTLYTTQAHFSHYISVFYPSAISKHEHFFGSHPRAKIRELPQINKSVKNWLFITEPINKVITDALTQQGLLAKLILQDGYFGEGKLWIYRILDRSQYRYDYDFTQAKKWLRNGHDATTGIRYLSKGGISYGPHLKLYAGRYLVTINGQHLDRAHFECNAKEIRFSLDALTVTPTRVTYYLTIDRTYDQVELRVLNDSDDLVALKSISLQAATTTP